jgi:hypothetical protein
MSTSGNDINGIQYFQPLTAEGYTISYFNDTYTYVKNFRTDGSMRSNFRGIVMPSHVVMGYFKVTGASPLTDAEEVACQMNGGTHTGAVTDPDFDSTSVPNAAWADQMDIGITNFLGTTSRVRFEKTHPTYSSAFPPTFEELPIGDVRGVWRGYAGYKINLDTNGDGRLDTIALIGCVDIDGLIGGTTPANNWKITYKRLFLPSEIDLKAHWRPYVAMICHPEGVEYTVRIDQQVHADWISTDPAVQPYKYTTLKEVRQV